MDQISSTYGSNAATESYRTYRTHREADSAPTSAEGPGGHSSPLPKPAASDADTQLGLQPSSNTTDEFRPYGPDGLNKTSRTTDPSSPEQKDQLPSLPVETTQQDPQTRQVIAQLKSTEEKVKAHEAAHKSAGGAATGPISYSYTRGPDGKNYITGGEVPITISSGRTPQETITRMQQVIQAALAPADPSPQDRAVAAQAAAMQQAARQEQTSSQASAAGDTTVTGSSPAKINTEDPAVTGNSNRDMQQSRRAYSDPAVTGKESPAVNRSSQQQQSNHESATNGHADEAGRTNRSSGSTSSTPAGSGPARTVSFYS